MFSGIVEEYGNVVSIEEKENLSIIRIKAKKVAQGTKEGDSISVAGVCLTVVDVRESVLTFDIMKETIDKTILGHLRPGKNVNLERALKMSDRISGHFVSGHVDNMETVKDVITGPNYTELQITICKELAKYIVPKGSVCLDGVSLTIGDVRETFFSVYLIPFTLEVTTLGQNRKGDKINIETDILAKYILSGYQESKSPYVYQE
jgi:riboflavin synthase